VLSNGALVATGSTRTGFDSQVTFTSSQPAVYLIRALSRSAVFGATYLLQSATGQWTGAYDYWATDTYQAPVPQPTYGDCRSTVIQMGFDASSMMFCDGAEPNCAIALLRAGHAPPNLTFCQGVDPQCALSILESGRAPTDLQYCR
jgi:hypothetical protein